MFDKPSLTNIFRTALCLSLACLSNFFSQPGWAQDETKVKTEASIREPVSLVCYGVVSDETGKPLPNASIRLIGGTGMLNFGASPLIVNSPLVQKKNVEANGSFRFETPSDTENFLSTYMMGRGDCSLVVNCDGYSLFATPVSMDRMRTDLPFEIKLSKSEPVNIRINDAAGQPLVGARLCPAKVGSVGIPLVAAQEFSFESNEDGTANFEFHGSDTSHFFVTHESIGSQQLPATKAKNNGLSIVALPVGSVSGSLEFPSDEITKQVANKTVTLLSSQAKAYQATGHDTTGWQQVKINADGSFKSGPLALGTIQFHYEFGDNFPYSSPNIFDVNETTLEVPNLKIEQTFESAAEIKFQVTDGEGKPLTGIIVNSKSTDKFGFATQFSLVKSPASQAFPHDPVGEYLMNNNFGVMIRKLSNEKVNVIKVAMSKSATVEGTVVNQAGDPVVGAIVVCDVSAGRFANKIATLSDIHGKFALRNVPPNAALKVSASKDNLASSPDKPALLNSGSPPDDFQLVLLAQATASVAGTFVDQFNLPVENVDVKVMKAVVYEQEGFGGESFGGAPLNGLDESQATNSQGEFEFPPTPEFSERLQVRVDDKRFFPFQSPYIDATRLEAADGRLDLSTFRLFRRPELISTTIEITDRGSGKPIPNAEVVFLGIAAGKTIIETDDLGSGTAQLAAAPQLAAIRAAGYPIQFRWLDEISTKLVFKLGDNQLSSAEPSTESLHWFAKNRDEYFDCAKELLNDVDQPDSTSTFYRQNLYFSAAAIVAPDDFLATVSGAEPEYTYAGNFFMFHESKAFHQRPERCIREVMTSELEPYQNVALLSMYALRSSDPALQDELFGEAVVAFRESVDKQQLYSAGSLAVHLLLAGKTKVAELIVAEAWDGATELKKTLADRAPKEDIGVARMFLPALAIVDHEAALALVPLVAMDREIDSVIGQLLANVSLHDSALFEKLAAEHQSKDGETKLSLQRISQSFSSLTQLPDELSDWPRRIANHLPNGAEKIQMSLWAMENASNDEQRKRDLENLLTAIRDLPPVRQEFYWGDAVVQIIERIKQFENLKPAELDEIIFEVMKNRPPKYEANGSMEMLALFARLLAIKDADLARRLLEPAFENRSWLFTYQTGADFENCQVLRSTAWIDPTWAVELTRELSDELEIDTPVRRLSLVSGVIDELYAVGSTRPAKVGSKE